MSELYPTKEALDAAGTGAQEELNETFGQLDGLPQSSTRADSVRGEKGRAER